MTKLFRSPRSLLFLACFVFAASAIWAQDPMQDQAPSVETKTPTQLQLMQRIEDSWSDSIAKRDQYGLELVLSPQFVNISSEGDVRTRNQQISTDLTGSSGLISIEQKVVSVRTLGDVAIVNGTYILRRKEGSGAIDEKGIFTHVFQKTRSNWQCINAQRTVVAEQGVQKGKVQASAAKKSSAELPFHIPLFHKGADSAAVSEQPSDKTSPQ